MKRFSPCVDYPLLSLLTHDVNGDTLITDAHLLESEFPVDTPTTTPMNDLLDELFCVLTTLRHFYLGMSEDIAKDNYTPEQAERDWTTLTYNTSHGDVRQILADIIALGKADEK